MTGLPNQTLIERQHKMRNNIEYQVIEDNGGTLHMFVFRDIACLFASPVLPCDIANCIDDVENASSWDEDLALLTDIMQEKGLDTLTEARAEYFQSLTYGKHAVKVIMQDGEYWPESMGAAGLDAYKVVLARELNRLKSLETEDVKVTLEDVEDEDAKIIRLNYPKNADAKDDAAVRAMKELLEKLGMQEEYRDAVSSENFFGVPVACRATGYWLEERYVECASAIL